MGYRKPSHRVLLGAQETLNHAFDLYHAAKRDEQTANIRNSLLHAIATMLGEIAALDDPDPEA